MSWFIIVPWLVLGGLAAFIMHQGLLRALKEHNCMGPLGCIWFFYGPFLVFLVATGFVALLSVMITESNMLINWWYNWRQKHG